MVRTTQGDMPKEHLGVTFVHEHLLNQAGTLVGDDDANLDQADVLSAELGEAMMYGMRTLVEVSTFEMSRDLTGSLRIAEALGLNLVLSTGFFYGTVVPHTIRRMHVDRLAEMMLNDLRGLNASGVCSGVIGEIGISPEGFRPWERRIHEAAALAHRDTGCPIITHTCDGAQAMTQAEMLITMGVRPRSILVCHVDADHPIEDHLNLLQTGVMVSLDRIGDHRRCNDAIRAQRVTELVRRGHGERILLSHDLARKSRLKAHGGHGYSHLLASFVPRLRHLGIEAFQIERLTTGNPAEFLEWKRSRR